MCLYVTSRKVTYLQNTENKNTWQRSANIYCMLDTLKVKVKEAYLYSVFIEIPYTQGAQVRITQCYLQTTPHLPLPRKHSPDGASQTEVVDI